jgi:predicted RNA-binding protein
MTTKNNNESLPPRIVAAYEAVSEMFIDSSRIFKGKLYPLRIRLRPIASFQGLWTSGDSFQSYPL